VFEEVRLTGGFKHLVGANRTVLRAKDNGDTLLLLVRRFCMQEVIIQHANLLQLQTAVARQAQVMAATQNIDHAIKIAAGVVASGLLRFLSGAIHVEGVSGLDGSFYSEGAADASNFFIYFRP